MLVTAIILGFAGSLHCAGMCSPLVMAVTSLQRKAMLNKMIYNSGRIFTYALLGALISVAGGLINFSDFQFILTLSIATVLIIMGLSGISGMHLPIVTPLLLKFSTWVKIWFGKFLQRKTVLSMWTMGMLNGLLPCGLTYLALTYCLTLQTPVDGFQFMLLFGVGTLPVMVGFTSVLRYLIQKFHLDLNKFSRVSFILIGVIVLARLYFAQNHLVHQATEQIGIIFCR
jgi:uncharacterized protein